MNLIKTTIRFISGSFANHRTLFVNFSFLSCLQVFNVGLPLITYPYLIRVLGKDVYGLLVFAQAIIAYLIVFVNFGFNTIASRDVSINRDDLSKLSELVSAILYIKIAFFLLCGGLLVSLMFFVPVIGKYPMLFFMTFAIGIEQILYPIWFFQGIEKMKYITYIEISSKTTFAVLIFFFIHSPADFLWMPGLLAVGALTGGCFSCYLIFSKYGIKLQKVPISFLVNYIKTSSPFFISNVSGCIRERTNILVIGSFLGVTEVAYYDLVNKVVNILRIPFYILNETVYPHVARTQDMGFIRKIIMVSVTISLILYFSLVVGAKPIILILAGRDLLPAQPLFALMGLVLPIIGISYLLGNNTLVVMGHSKYSNLSEIFSSVLFILILGALLLVNQINVYTVIIAYLASNIFILIYRLYYCLKLKLFSLPAHQKVSP